MGTPIWSHLLLIKNSRVFYGTGINEYNVDGIKTIHAEVNACKKVKKTDNKKKIIYTVYRTNKAGTNLLCSKPCFNCLKTAYFTMKRKNYIISRFYFFNSKNELDFYKTKEIKKILNQ